MGHRQNESSFVLGDVRNRWTERRNWKENKIMENFNTNNYSSVFVFFLSYMIMFHVFHISLNTNLAQVRLVKLYKWNSRTLFWKELTWERSLPLCHFCFVSGLQWMNEWEGEWIGHTGFACHLVIWGTEDKDFKVGPSALGRCSVIAAVLTVDEPAAWDLCSTSPYASVCLTRLY